MATLFYSLPVSLLRQYAFCPRIPWFMETLGLNPPRPHWVGQGLDHHRRQKMLQRRRRLSRYGLDKAKLIEEPNLRSETLGLHGVPDAIMETEKAVFPLEFKLGAFKPSAGHILQVTAYAMLAEEVYGKPAPEGFILYGDRGKTLRLCIDEKARSKLREVKIRLFDSLREGLIPSSSASAAQCTQCEFLNHCNDRE